MTAQSAAREPTYYFISDLHIGGDGRLNECEFEGELIAFLRELAEAPGPAELIIVGDAFGLWETTHLEGAAKLDWILRTHAALFEQFRRTGEHVVITLIPGNHDYELAVFPECRELLAACNIRLESEVRITRALAGRKLWIEHGNQRDEFNRIPDFGNRWAMPLGYFVTTATVAASGRTAAASGREWIDDLESVYPNEEIPYWLVSNYFYREMSGYLRWMLLPFFLLFSISALVLLGRGLEAAGLLPAEVFSRQLGDLIGFPGRLLDLILWVNATLLFTMLLLAVPALLTARDLRATLRRFGVDPGRELKVVKDEEYLAAAREVFAADPQVALFVYGHTHIPSVTPMGERLVVNTGTWLKRLVRVAPRNRWLPSVFVPSFRLNYFSVSAEEERIVVRYRFLPKEPGERLNLLQRVLIWRRDRNDLGPIPAETVIPAASSSG